MTAHSGTRAAAATRTLGASAYTQGAQVAFSRQPDLRLAAHEAAHVLQQRGGARPWGHDHARLERQADQVAERIVRGQTATPLLREWTPGARAHSSVQLQEVEFDLREPTPQEQRFHEELGLELPHVSRAALDPRNHSDYVDRRIEAVGFGIYLGGYLLYLRGMSLPVFVPEAHCDHDLSATDSTLATTTIYPTWDAAVSALPVGPVMAGAGRPFATYRGAGGAVIAPTYFNAATAPRVVATMLQARRDLAAHVQEQLTGVAIGLVGAAVMRVTFAVIARAARWLGRGGVPAETPPPRAPPEPEAPPRPRPPDRTRSPRPRGPGDRERSSAARAEREAAEVRRPMTAAQRQMADTLQHEHPRLHRHVAEASVEGAESVGGPGVAGADVRLLNGGGREVTVHSGAFSEQSIARHLQEEAAQAGTTEIYMQMTAGSREAMIRMAVSLRRAYRELDGVFIRFFGPDGRAWWSGRFFGPRG